MGNGQMIKSTMTGENSSMVISQKMAIVMATGLPASRNNKSSNGRVYMHEPGMASAMTTCVGGGVLLKSASM